MSAIHCSNCGCLAGVDHGWQKSEPRKNGTVIVAMGNIVSRWADGVSVEPFTAEIRWAKTDSGYEGWLYAADGSCVAVMEDDEVHVIWWIDLPKEEPAHAAEKTLTAAQLEGTACVVCGGNGGAEGMMTLDVETKTSTTLFHCCSCPPPALSELKRWVVNSGAAMESGVGA